MEKLELDSFYHHLRLPEQLRTIFWATIDVYWKRQRKVVAVLSFRSHGVASLSDDLENNTRRALVLKSVTERENEVKERNLWIALRSPIGRYIDDFLFLSTELRKLMKNRNCACGPIERGELELNDRRSSGPTKKRVTILGIEFEESGRSKQAVGSAWTYSVRPQRRLNISCEI